MSEVFPTADPRFQKEVEDDSIFRTKCHTALQEAGDDNARKAASLAPIIKEMRDNLVGRPENSPVWKSYQEACSVYFDAMNPRK